jgi:hypothetical protein
VRAPALSPPTGHLGARATGRWITSEVDLSEDSGRIEPCYPAGLEAGGSHPMHHHWLRPPR